MNRPADSSGPLDRAEEWDDELPAELMLGFAPLHKRAFGMAWGLVSGLLVVLLTVVGIVLPEGREGIALLAEYFAGYSVSWRGAVVGFAWGWFVGFVAGWFLAFMRNLTLAVSFWIGRTREELAATRDFLDHI